MSRETFSWICSTFCQIGVKAELPDLNVLDVHSLLTAAMAQRALASGAIDENAPHRLGRRAEEMSASFELWILIADETQPGFMHQYRFYRSLLRRLVSLENALDIRPESIRTTL